MKKLVGFYLEVFDRDSIFHTLSIIDNLSTHNRLLRDSIKTLESVQRNIMKWNETHASVFQCLAKEVLATRYGELDQLKAKLAHAVHAKSEMESNRDEFKQRWEQSVSINSAQSKEVQALKDANAVAGKELAVCRQDLNVAMKSLHAARAQVRELQALGKAQEAKDDKEATLAAMLSQSEQGRLVLTEELHDAKQQVQKFQLRVSELETKNASWSTERQRILVDNTKLVEANRSFKKQIEDLMSNDVAFRTKLASSAKELQAAQGEIVRLQHKQESAVDQNEVPRLRERLATTVQKISSLEDQLVSRNAEICKLQSIIQSSTTPVTHTSSIDRSHISALETQIKSLQIELATKEQARKQLEREKLSVSDCLRATHQVLNDIHLVLNPRAPSVPMSSSSHEESQFATSTKSAFLAYIHSHPDVAADKSSLAEQCARAEYGDTVVAVPNPSEPGRFYVMGNLRYKIRDASAHTCIKFFREQPFIIGKVIMKQPFEDSFLLEIEPVRNALPKALLGTY
jgi:chromosome segregation ATPase